MGTGTQQPIVVMDAGSFQDHTLPVEQQAVLGAPVYLSKAKCDLLKVGAKSHLTRIELGFSGAPGKQQRQTEHYGTAAGGFSLLLSDHLIAIRLAPFTDFNGKLPSVRCSNLNLNAPFCII